MDSSAEDDQGFETLSDEIMKTVSSELVDLEELSLVSKKFYAHCCALEAFQRALVIDNIRFVSNF